MTVDDHENRGIIEIVKSKPNPMAGTWTKAALVRRRIKAGRPSRVNEILTPLQAANRLVNEVEKARSLMVEAGLAPEDVKAGLVYRSGDNGGLTWPPRAGGMATFVDRLEKMQPPPEFVGIVWEQIDWESGTNGVGQRAVWPVQFLWGPEDTHLVFALANQYMKGMDTPIRIGGP